MAESVVTQVVDNIFSLAEVGGSGVYREGEEAVSWGDRQSSVRLLNLADVGVCFLQVVEDDGEVASTRAYLFDGTGILSTIFTSVPVEALAERDWVEEAIASDPTGGATSEADEADFFNALFHPLQTGNND